MTSGDGGAAGALGGVRDPLAASLGRPLQRPSAAEFVGAWTIGERDAGDIATMSSEFLGTTWDCFEVADWFIEARAGQSSGRWSLSLRAVPVSRWAEVSDVLGAGAEESWDRAWSVLPPTLLHPLFTIDVVLRHGGEPWARQTTRTTDPVEAAHWQALVRGWSAEFVADLPHADCWVEGEHRDSAAVTSHEIFRVWTWQLGVDLVVIPRDGSRPPGLPDVLGRIDHVRPLRRRSRFTDIVRGLPEAWDVAEGRTGDALVLSAPALDQLTQSEMVTTGRVLTAAEPDFWIYELAARGPFTAADLTDLWQRSRTTAAPTGAAATPVSGDLQIVVVTRDGDLTIDEIFQRLELSADPRDDGRFGQLLRALPDVWDIEEAASGDALLLEIPKGRFISQAEVDATASALDRMAPECFAVETRTMGSFTSEALQEWWQEEQTG